MKIMMKSKKKKVKQEKKKGKGKSKKCSTAAVKIDSMVPVTQLCDDHEDDDIENRDIYSKKENLLRMVLIFCYYFSYLPICGQLMWARFCQTWARYHHTSLTIPRLYFFL
ncbi:hypothetical protein WA026_004628 [Henosepilachna vigintioctopunctata]|uniref:Uncharacterized protein n=1 Tax=Henosepilachna vigintioctopunctata TaxID=420089 RepID=A0AAW1VBE2_9CUCU